MYLCSVMIYCLHIGRNLDRLVSLFIMIKGQPHDAASQSEVFNLGTAALH